MELLVAADDRTGALETAGALASAGLGPVPVVTTAAGIGARAEVVVIDLGTRHLGDAEAQRRAGELGGIAARHHAHKIDSTLRGRWAAEVAARRDAAGSAALVVAALPSLARTCEGGIVRERGRPVHEGPARHDGDALLTSSRPRDLLREVGERDVVELADADDLRHWITAPTGVAVCDARTDRDLEAIGACWAAAPGVLLAGTSASIAAGATEVGGARSGTTTPTAGASDDAGLPGPVLRGPVLVVCGSLHPAARAQIDHAVDEGLVVVAVLGDDGGVPGVVAGHLRSGRSVVLVPPAPRARPTNQNMVETAAALAGRAADVLACAAAVSLLVIGGDTAAAVLGTEPVEVDGELAPGTPVGRTADGSLFATRAGGFGGPDALSVLLRATLMR